MRIELTSNRRQALLVSRDQSLAALASLTRSGGFQVLHFPDAGAAKGYLQGFAGRPGSVAALRRALQPVLPVGFILRLSDDELLTELGRRIADGRIQVVEREGRPSHPPMKSSGAGAAPAPAEFDELPPPAAEPPPPAPPKEEAAPEEEPEEAPQVDPVIPEEVDLIAQAAVLEQASQSGAAACEA